MFLLKNKGISRVHNHISINATIEKYHYQINKDTCLFQESFERIFIYLFIYLFYLLLITLIYYFIIYVLNNE